MFGGVSETIVIRGDRIRCQGPFRSSNLGGMFPATLLPLMIGLWFQETGKKKRAFMGIMGCLAATVFSNSSGAVMCVGAGIVGFLLWKVRDRMSWFAGEGWWR